MYARELRKWSLKYQMSFLWLSAMVTLLLLSVYCPNATSMHLPINTNSRDTALRITPAASGSSNWWFNSPNTSNINRISNSKQTKISDSSSSSYISSSSSSISNTNTKYYDSSYNPLAVFSGLRNHNARAKTPVNANANANAHANAHAHAYTAAVSADNADFIDVTDTIHQANNHNININNNNNDNNYYVPNVPNSNSQINYNFRSYANSLTKSAYDSSNSRSNKLRRHTNQSNANYHSPVRVATPSTFHHQPAEMVSALSPSASPSPSLSSSSLSSPSAAPPQPSPIPIKFVGREELRQLLQQQSHNRTMLLEAAAAARSRRDSATYGYLRNTSSSAALSAGSYQHPSKHHNSRNSNNNNNNSNNRRNNNNNNNIHRKRQRRYCSARDPAQLAFEAPTVVESKIISMEADRLANFAVSFAVQKVFKRQIEFSLKRNDYMRLQFTQRNTSAVCDIYKEKLVPRGLVRSEDLEQGRIYLLFVQQMDQSNFQILGQPIRRTQRVTESVMKAVREDYAQLASIRSITASNRTGEVGRELQIVCKVQGQPPPKVTWFKDHKSINHNRRLYQFNHYKKKSELIIKSFNYSDAGVYECRAKNKVNKKVEKKNIVVKAKKPRGDVSTQQSGEKCPEDVSEFCFNGGTCKFFMEIHSYSCICTEGFIGERCDRKEMPPSTYSNEHECRENKFYGSYYC